jgi:sugar lactone lactonase YvrE
MHSWDAGGHETKYATKIFPDVMRWLWKDWPAPVKAGAGSPHHKKFLLPEEPWKLVPGRYQDTTSPAANTQGEVFFCDAPAGKIYKVESNGTVSVFLADSQHATGLACGPKGLLYATAGDQVVAYDAGAKATVLARDIRGHRVAAGPNGNVYVTSRAANETEGSKLWLLPAAGEKRVVDADLKRAASVAFTADRRFLCVTDGSIHQVYSYLIQPDGSLIDDASGADGMCADRDGLVYVATQMGVQVCQASGQTLCIIPTPNGKVSGLCFGGPQLDTLYATCGDKVFQRKVRVHGAQP